MVCVGIYIKSKVMLGGVKDVYSKLKNKMVLGGILRKEHVLK
jgi:hypothetical protein